MDVEALMCQNCERLKRIEELELENSLLKFENSLLRFENVDLKRRLAFYENAHVAPSQRKFPVRKPKACWGLGFQAGLRVMLVGLGLGLSLTSLRLQR